MDEKDRELCNIKLQHLEERMKVLETHEQICKGEIFPRINALELWRASSMASSWKGAFVIGTCSMIGATIAVILSHLMKVAR